ncbi:MAG: endolytic transglycosylase MltG [Bacteroidales bacterium]|nr:endolytic transglycosylase MltG [Bacteroidales bacterium]
MNIQRIFKYAVVAVLVIVVTGAIYAFNKYQKYFKPNVKLEKSSEVSFYIKTGSNFNQLYNDIRKANILKDTAGFKETAELKNLPNHIHPGRYVVPNGISNNKLVDLFRSGQQSPLNVTFNNQRTLSDLAKRLSTQLEPSKEDFIKSFNDTGVISKYNLNKHTFKCLFIPNTYELWWNTTPEKFIARMHKEYNRFWEGKRERTAKSMGLTREEVIILASIVQQETRMNDEKPTVAGLYFNRLKRRIKLDSDPTLIYAMNDFSIKRVLNKHKKIDSPYNTYKHGGLPPGPICIPDISSIDAVLKYEHHNYLYMCAKPDFSGYHNFAKTLQQHNRNANAYRRELNKRRIYR